MIFTRNEKAHSVEWAFLTKQTKNYLLTTNFTVEVSEPFDTFT
jgi:hypothetical protein